jgi:hypothetical protein
VNIPCFSVLLFTINTFSAMTGQSFEARGSICEDESPASRTPFLHYSETLQAPSSMGDSNETDEKVRAETFELQTKWVSTTFLF